MFELHHLTAQEQWDRLHRRDITPLELVDHYLARIERLNPSLGAFTTVTADEARVRAASLAPGPRPLWGLPLGDKDLWRRAGVRTTFGSRLFASYVPETSDELVRQLDDAGAISLGKTHAPEFGFPAYTESRVAPPAVTPYAVDLGAGGSSGGAAVAVAAGLLPFAPGSDGGGSIRIPAAATGLVGLKPSRGRVPAGSGLASLGGLVVAGPLARTVADAAMLLDAMVDAPYEFSTRAPRWDEGAYLGAAVRGEGRFQLGVTTSSPWETEYAITVSPEARDALGAATRELDALGHGLEEFELEPAPTYGPAFRTIWMAGAANVAAETPDELALLEPLTAWLVERGRAVTARELATALGELSSYERSIIRQMGRFDAIVMPTLALTPRPLGWFSAEDPALNFEQQCLYAPFSSFVNVAGLPAITLPVHVTAEGLPMGVQLVGRPGREDVLLAIGAQLERRIRWQHSHPPQW